MLLILAEALTTVIHLINLSYAIAFNGDVAARVWSGKNVSYNDLKGFLGAKPLRMFLRMRGQSCMLKLGDISFLIMVKINLAIISLIQLRNFLEIVILYCLKIKQLKILEKQRNLILRVLRA